MKYVVTVFAVIIAVIVAYRATSSETVIDSNAPEMIIDSDTVELTKTFDIDSEYMIITRVIMGDMGIADKDSSYTLHPTDSVGIVYDPNIIEDFIRTLFEGLMRREPNGITLRKDRTI